MLVVECFGKIMTEILSVMKWPLIACLLLPGILVYLGLHIVRREVIFVDLALAQVAALGMSLCIKISFEPERAVAEGTAMKWWDFLFYALFGLVVTSFLQIGGVLLVFSYLIVPAVCANFLASRLASLLLIGWLTATAASVIGLYI